MIYNLMLYKFYLSTITYVSATDSAPQNVTNYIMKPVTKNCKLKQLSGQTNTRCVSVSYKVSTSVTIQIPSAGAGWHSYQHAILTFNFHFSPSEKCVWELYLIWAAVHTLALLRPSHDHISPPTKSSTEGTPLFWSASSSPPTREELHYSSPTFESELP